MPKKPPPRLQAPAGPELPRAVREVYATALLEAEHELRAAQAAVRLDDCNANRERYALALATYDRLQGSFPFIAAGLSGDAEA